MRIVGNNTKTPFDEKSSIFEATNNDCILNPCIDSE
jgi:hypothetical protein